MNSLHGETRAQMLKALAIGPNVPFWYKLDAFSRVLGAYLPAISGQAVLASHQRLWTFSGAILLKMVPALPTLGLKSCKFLHHL
jgi:hypothetical protein